MANNENVNKVSYNNSVLIDLTEDTITPEVVVSGYTAHDRSGASISGTFVPVTGVKGSSESSYRTGNVNLTPADIGALPSSTSIPSKTSDLTNDSGFLTSHQDISGKKNTQSAVSDPTASGTSLSFIDSITQNAQGVISPTKKTVAEATTSASGLMSSSDKSKLNGIASGAQVNSIIGIKGDAESTYRTGNVNLTPANIGAIAASAKGAASGVAELDSNGKVPSSQLPSYVDDVLEYAKSSSFPTTGEAGKIYIAQDTNKTYRWSGTAYVEISASLALGTTSSTAYRGDYGNVAYTHAVTNKGSAFSSGLYKITTNSEGHVTAATAIAKSDITGLGIPGSDTHRAIQVNGTQALGNNTTALNLKAGSNVTITDGGSGAITIAATDTNTWRGIQDNLTSSSNTTESLSAKQGYLLANGSARDSTKVSKSGDTMTGNLITPSIRIANTYYGITYGMTHATPVETILHTGIKWASSSHMPVIHITGYAYGLQSPVEFKIGFYIYNNKIGYCGVTNMGAWQPNVFLFKDNHDNYDYVGVGLAGSCYYLQLQADLQDEMAKFNYTETDSSKWSWTFSTTTGVIPATDGGTTCIQVPYKANILDPSKVNGHTVEANVPSDAKFTDTNTWRPVSDSVSSTSSSDAASSKAVKTAYDLAASKTANTGTVTSVVAGTGLSGGTITGSGTLKAKLRSETALTIDSAAATTTSGRVYPVAVDKTGYLAVNVPWISYSNATTSAAGLMSAADKTKSDSIEIATLSEVKSYLGIS